MNVSAPESEPSVGILCLRERASNNNTNQEVLCFHEISLLVLYSHNLLDARGLISSFWGLGQHDCFIGQTY